MIVNNPVFLRFLKTAALFGFCFLFLGNAGAQDKSTLSLERIYSSSDFSSQRFGPARWLDEGNSYTTLESSEDSKGGHDIVEYDTNSGERTVLVSASRLVPAGQKNPLRINNYIWSPEKERLMIFTNTARVWRQNTRGDYWVLNLNDWNLQKLGGAEAKPSTLMFAKFSPDGNRIAYVRENNMYVEELDSGGITQLTNDGTTDIINGTFDWVYEEEFGQRDGFRWSPDGTQIAYWQLDASGVGNFKLINNTDSVYSQVTSIQYPKVGTTNSAARVGVVSSAGGETTWMKIAGDERNNYIPRMEWAAGSDELIIQRMNRQQNANKVLLADAKTGNIKRLFTEEDEAWVDAVNDLVWMNEGSEFTWVSERDGWRHIYRVSRDGTDIKLITPGDYDVLNIEVINEQTGWVYFIASPENATQRYLFRAKLDSSGEPERLSPENQSGSHRYQISPDTKWAFHTYTNANTPNTISLIELPSHKVQRVMAENEVLKKTVASLNINPMEFFQVDIGEGVTLDAYMIKPHDFNPSKKYPVLFQVYGEPAGQTVMDRWGGSTYLWHQMLAQQGYVVMSVDNRGTPGPKGRDWRKSIYGQIGILASEDQAAALKEIIKTYDFVDAERIGIWGWSGGGSMTLNMMFRYPELYRTGMSVAPVANQLYYDTIYQERYMGLPGENEEGYRKGSPITYAKNLEGNLLIMHGTGDDNVHYQNTEALVNELIKHNKIFSMMAYPNRTHGIYERENTSRHVRETLTWYLKNNLPAGAK